MKIIKQSRYQTGAEATQIATDPNVKDKILPFNNAASTFDELRALGKKIVHCHGTFDLVHPGHIIHLEEAKELGDILVVTLTDESHVNKGPGRPYFNDDLRLRSLAALASVDYVISIPHTAAIEAIELVKPDIYCKGKEYESAENDATGNIHDDVATVNKFGGKVHYVGSVVFSSTKMLNNHFGITSKEVKDYCVQLAAHYSPGQFRDAIESFNNLKVLIIGDIIFDRYTHVSVQGLTTKNRTLSSRHLKEETHFGGALAVYRHLKEFCEKVDIISLAGQEPWAQDLIRQCVPQEDDKILRIQDFTTIIKQRFVESAGRSKELAKLFAINYLDEKHPNGSTQSKLCQQIDSIIQDYDLVVVTDFGHGVMQSKVRELVQEKASFLALNCQTNSNNHGYNIINRQYQRADCFTLDEQELKLACGLREPEFEQELTQLKQAFGAQYGWVTRGSKETIGINGSEEFIACPVLEKQITDTIGAGDAFFAVAALAAYRHIPINQATFLGQLAGAQAVRIVGNSTAIEKVKLLKGGMSLLNY